MAESGHEGGMNISCPFRVEGLGGLEANLVKLVRGQSVGIGLGGVYVCVVTSENDHHHHKATWWCRVALAPVVVET
jgi:hypothetical protein